MRTGVPFPLPGYRSEGYEEGRTGLTTCCKHKKIAHLSKLEHKSVEKARLSQGIGVVPRAASPPDALARGDRTWS